MESLINNLDADLLAKFVACAQNNDDWNGDLANQNLFKIWRSSLNKETSVDPTIADNPEENIPAANQDNNIAQPTGDDEAASLPDLTTEIGNALHNSDLQADSIIQCIENAPFVIFESESLGPEEVITPADVQFIDNQNGASAEVENSNDVYKLLNETRSMNIPPMKRQQVKKFPVMSSQLSINMRKKPAPRQTEPKPKQTKIEKRKRKDSFVETATPSSSSVQSTPRKPPRKVAKRAEKKRDIPASLSLPSPSSTSEKSYRRTARKAIFSPSSSAPATPCSAEPDSSGKKQNKPSTSSGVRARRPLNFYSSDSE